MSSRIDAIDQELLKVHADYLRAERRCDIDEATRLFDRMDALLDERLHIPTQRAAPY